VLLGWSGESGVCAALFPLVLCLINERDCGKEAATVSAISFLAAPIVARRDGKLHYSWREKRERRSLGLA
jgi:hypothetical protein